MHEILQKESRFKILSGVALRGLSRTNWSTLYRSFYIFLFAIYQHPTIAQLAERETVAAKQLSLGHWFESGWSETFFIAQKAVYDLG